MPWLLLILTASTGLHFAPELASVLSVEASELRLVIGGALLGLLLAFLTGLLEAWLSETRRRRL